MEVAMSAQRILDSIEKSQRRTATLPEFRPGDSIKVWAKIREGEKTRLQAFEGVCIRRVSKGARATFTVRKISYGVGVERIFPDNSPNIDKVEVIARGRPMNAAKHPLSLSERQIVDVTDDQSVRGIKACKRSLRPKIVVVLDRA